MLSDVVSVQGVMFVSHAMEIKADSMCSSITNPVVCADTKVKALILSFWKLSHNSMLNPCGTLSV